MTDTMHDVHKLSFNGGIDADSHILEPLDLWTDYIDPQYRARALRVEIDADGLEAMVVDDRRPLAASRGSMSLAGAMGERDLRGIQLDPDRTYDVMAPFGSQSPSERLRLMDAENLDASIIYPTVGLVWEVEVPDEALTMAHLKAYNRWVTEWCSDGDGRLVPIAHISMTFPEASVVELERAANAGAKGCFVSPYSHDRKPFGHRDHDPIFAACQDLDIPLAIHPTLEPESMKGDRMGPRENSRHLALLPLITGADGVRQQFVAMFDMAVYDRFPDLKVVLLEAGGSWLPYFLDRVDALFEHTGIGTTVRLQRKPSDYLREQIWVSCDPDEQSIPHLIDRFGDRFLWASDFPHRDHTPDYILELDRTAGAIPAAQRGAFLGDNARHLFKTGA